MAERPTMAWRRAKAEEARRMAAGELRPDWARSTASFPEELLVATDTAMAAFEASTAGLAGAADQAILAIVKRLVLSLNEINDEYGAFEETVEREMLSGYVDHVLTQAGIDTSALAARHGMGRYEIGDEWRQW
jgi:hypothetical protein